MTNTENTETTETHEDHCRTNDQTTGNGLDWGCTCNWTEQDETWLRQYTD